jgi:putative transposase
MEKRAMIEAGHATLSVRRQCRLLGLARSGLYYEPRGESPEGLGLMRLIDEAYTRWPFYGVRKMTAHLGRQGHPVNVKRVRRLMRLMGLEAIYPKKRLSLSGEGHKRYPYLLCGVEIVRPDQVWSADITYVRLRGGFVYLVAILDWYSRYVLAWALSASLDGAFCVWALEEALRAARPEIFNTDQGVQFTSEAFTGVLEAQGVAISMDGRGRVFDNIFSERLWRTVKYEEVYLKDYADPGEARAGLGAYFRFYNEGRPHQALGYRTPAEVYYGRAGGEGGRAAARPVAGTPVALRAPSVPATLGSSDYPNPSHFWS